MMADLPELADKHRFFEAVLAGDLAALEEMASLAKLPVREPSPVRLASYAGMPQFALHYAAAGGHEDVVRYLVETHGADLECADGEGDRPLAWAHFREQPGTYALLELLGAHQVTTSPYYRWWVRDDNTTNEQQ